MGLKGEWGPLQCRGTSLSQRHLRGPPPGATSGGSNATKELLGAETQAPVQQHPNLQRRPEVTIFFNDTSACWHSWYII